MNPVHEAQARAISARVLAKLYEDIEVNEYDQVIIASDVVAAVREAFRAGQDSLDLAVTSTERAACLAIINDEIQWRSEAAMLAKRTGDIDEEVRHRRAERTAKRLADAISRRAP